MVLTTGIVRRKQLDAAPVKDSKGLHLFLVIVSLSLVSFGFIQHSLRMFDSNNAEALLLLPFGGAGSEDNPTPKVNFTENYLRPPYKLFMDGFLVENAKCRIPNIDIRSEDMRWHFKIIHPSDVQCVTDEEISKRENKTYPNGTVTNLTFVKKQRILFNESALAPLGIKLDSIKCCYFIVERVEQNITHYTTQADNKFRYSDTCYSITLKDASPKSGFIRVVCFGYDGALKDKQIYSDFHLLAMFPKKGADQNFTKARDKTLHNKLEYWKKCIKLRGSGNCGGVNASTPPPNVLLFGVESTSRMNFRRQMPNLTSFLESTLGAVEMKGYTKVGENTFPNMVPLLTSFFVEELTSSCMQNYSDGRLRRAVDDCPFLWKNFSARNYLTGHVEDYPGVQAFNYLKTGFVVQPVDFYPRPWAMAVYDDEARRCVSSKRPEQILLQYIADLVELSNSSGAPYFITSWITKLTHDNMNKAQHMDGVLRQTLLHLFNNGLLENALLVVMSDHGYRWGSSRRTTAGWYEDKMPALWIRLPTTVKEVLPSWKEALEHNARQLATPFDLHETMTSILDIKLYINGSLSLNTSNPVRGRSMFQKLPERSCEEAGVPPEYCACVPPLAYNRSMAVIEKAAATVMSRLNSGLPFPNCTILKVKEITASAIFNIEESLESFFNQEDTSSVGTFKDTTKFVLGIRTTPGDINLEPLLTYEATTGMFKLVNESVDTNLILDRECTIE